MKEFKDRLYDYIAELDWVSFCNIRQKFPESRGDMLFFVGVKNLCLYGGLSDLVIDALIDLRKDERIIYKPTHTLTYLIDGGLMKFPIPKRIPKDGFKTPRWMPTTIRTIDKEPSYYRISSKATRAEIKP